MMHFGGGEFSIIGSEATMDLTTTRGKVKTLEVTGTRVPCHSGDRYTLTSRIPLDITEQESLLFLLCSLPIIKHG